MRTKLKSLTICITAFAVFLVISQNLDAQSSSNLVRAGLRSSTYGIKPFPDSTWWFNVTSDMAARFPGTSKAVIWIVGYIDSNSCSLNFPNPNQGKSYSNIYFQSSDANEAYLNSFDKKGVKVWLQVEPSQANVLDLIDLVITRYKHHPCVTGFGIDVEWYKTSHANHNEGEAVTDAEAAAWSAHIKSYNKDYLLFTKHWLISKMPATFRTDIVFVDDGQNYPDMISIINEFENWGKAFTPAKVAFQYGYESDKIWWKNLANPPKNIGDAILNKCPNTSDLYWVDFTAYDIWPINFLPTSVSNEPDNGKPLSLNLYPNYPNPFNPTTTIRFSIPERSKVEIRIFDLLGREVVKLFDGELEPGMQSVTFNASGLASGVYLYRLTTPKAAVTKKLVLIK